jgi:hypothetical protein
MGKPEIMIAVVLALLCGAGLGATLMWKTMRGRFDEAMRRWESESREKLNMVTDKLRADLARAQNALSERTAAQAKEMAAATAEPRAAIVRLEQRLEMAYAELDRMRAELDPKKPWAKPDPDGFASTRPMTSRL